MHACMHIFVLHNTSKYYYYIPYTRFVRPSKPFRFEFLYLPAQRRDSVRSAGRMSVAQRVCAIRPSALPCLLYNTVYEILRNILHKAPDDTENGTAFRFEGNIPLPRCQHLHTYVPFRPRRPYQRVNDMGCIACVCHASADGFCASG